MRMKGDNCKALGNIGDYEIGARWHWKLQLNTVSVILLTFSVILATAVCIGFVYFWVQFAELSKTKATIMDMQEEVLKIHSALSLEIEEVRKLKEELLLAHVTHVGVDREKRSALLGKGGNLGSNKTKDISKLSKDKMGSSKSSSKNSSKSSSYYHHTSNSFHASAVHLERSNVSFSVTGSNGIITRWHPQYFSQSPEAVAQLEDHNSSLVIQSTGLYLVYAQLCYAATKENNSYEIRLINQGGSIHHSKIIAQCSAGTSVLENEITCYTSVAQLLQSGDRVYLQQVQKKRQLLMNFGRSFMGVIKLSD